jgi:hypothetical protein
MSCPLKPNKTGCNQVVNILKTGCNQVAIKKLLRSLSVCYKYFYGCKKYLSSMVFFCTFIQNFNYENTLSSVLRISQFVFYAAIGLWRRKNH